MDLFVNGHKVIQSFEPPPLEPDFLQVPLTLLHYPLCTVVLSEVLKM